MRAALFDEASRLKLGRIAGMFGSVHDGEVVNAARLLNALLRDKGTTLTEVLERLVELEALQPVLNTKPKPVDVRGHYSRRWQPLAEMCLAYPEHTNDREKSFLGDMAVRRDEPTGPQWEWLRNLVARVEAKEGSNG